MTGKKFIGDSYQTYFIADIASNHDGYLNKAVELIHMASEAGANAAKFQNFYAKTLVSDYGFRNLKNVKSHQSSWKSSVYKIYKQNEVSLEWTDKLSKACKKYNIDYFTAAYDTSIIKYLNKFVPAWKIGSGDITWHDHILKIASTKKPIILATGASSFEEINNIYKKIIKINKKICLMQCNTNYTGSIENFKHINLNVINTFKKNFPKAVLGLSDHTHGHETVLGAITLGARMIEKHFTDNNSKIGPDHKFSMNPVSWKEMIDRSRNLENALGDGKKIVEKNEKKTVILQRRSIRVKQDLKRGTKIKFHHLNFLRPCPNDALQCDTVNNFINKKLIKNIKKNEYLKKNHFFNE